MGGPRAYTEKTIKRLFGLSGNQCSFPGCSKRLVTHANAKDSNICHIEAANPGGERFNPDMSDAQRADYDNLILLCIQHHDETNDVEQFTVKRLKLMKMNHESEYLNERIKSNPSMLKNTVFALATVDLAKYPEEPLYNVSDTKEKILFNQMKEKAFLIREYSAYCAKLNALYTELENQGSIVKEKLLQSIKLSYEKVKSTFIGESDDSLKVIQENSDAIFDSVYQALYDKLVDSNYWEEDITLGLSIVMIDAFVRCKILEEPPA